MLKLLHFLQPYRFSVLLILILTFIQSLANLYLPGLTANIVDIGIINGDISYILRVGGLMLLVTLGGTLCGIAISYFAARVTTGSGRNIRKNLFAHIERLSLHEFNTITSASLITRTTNDTKQVEEALNVLLTMIIAAPLMCIGGIIMALTQDIGLAWILLVMIPVLVGGILLLVIRAMPLFATVQEKIDRLNLVLSEGLSGLRVIRAFNRVRHQSARFDQTNTDISDISIRIGRIFALMGPIIMLTINFSTIAIIWFGSIRIDSGELQVGALMAFLEYAMQILYSFLMFSMVFMVMPQALVSATRINEVLALTSDLTDKTDSLPVDTRKGSVTFQQVTFRYPGAEEPALADISFTANSGEVTAIIGGTGAGKSTLASLLLRFYDTDQGAIMINGINVHNLPLEHLRNTIGFVPQKAFLFSGTVTENICYGKEDATAAEVEHAASIAQASGFITQMSNGFASTIAQGGTDLSGGQRQRLSIARAFVRKPAIYVFDDSFSALDFKTDARLRIALKTETLNATVLIVAQRVSTIMDADQIIVLDQGQIAGTGTHQTLMASCEVYREIVSSQLSMEEIA